MATKESKHNFISPVEAFDGKGRRKPRSSILKIALKFLLTLLAAASFWWFLGSKIQQVPHLKAGHRPHDEVSKVSPSKGLPRPSCYINSNRSLKFEFEKLQNFNFTENFASIESSCRKPKRAHKDFDGSILLMTGSADQTSDIKVDVAINATDPFFTEHLQYSSSDNSLLITLPARDSKYHRNCVIVEVSVYFRPGLQLSNLSMNAVLSTLNVPSTVDLMVTEQTNVDLLVGSLKSHEFLASRETYIHVGAGHVIGQYPLYDVLSIETDTGHVSVDVVPQAADQEVPKPAILNITSEASAIHVNYPPNGTDQIPNCPSTDIGHIPKRDYYTSIRTIAGSIGGRYLHGRSTRVESEAGSISVELLPYSADGYTSNITSVNQAGNQMIRVLSPLQTPGEAMNRISSSHISSWGRIALQYPPEWEGKAYGQATMGSVSVQGNVNITERGSLGVGGEYVRAEKGSGSSELDFRTSFGSSSLTFV